MCTYVYIFIYYFWERVTDDSLHTFGSSKTCSFAAAFSVSSLNRLFTNGGSLPRNSRKR